jgi:two-component system alkaline phosphatase synthesis response regulator PhoP
MRSRILLVEDEQPIANYLALFLEQEGFQVERAANLGEADQATVRNQYDLILLDVMLPDGNADQWLPNWRKAHPDTPVLMVTGLGPGDERLRRCLHSGAAGWIPKTSRVEGLLGDIRRALRP